ncbi:MAG: peptidylprolyl isomerase [Blastochloris viridis]|uniref:Peptidyl-prolyl cis-trans isomerase n=1 Tax=Blastochloris viridis TaxID=1079 RepID=A0A6N4R3A6_BLAVI|nr:MAG: peptidylprolyl isomerase [Blastochloris viridis]
MKSLILSLLVGVLMTTAANAVEIKDPENTLFLDLKDGRVVIQMFPEKAPNHVARIKELTREGYYDGKLWHRVMDGFMAQTGSPNGDGIGGSSKPDLKAEFNNTAHVRGVASMARTNMPNTANAQFFIVLKPSTFLDGQYTAWGQVIDGMQYVDNITKADPRDPSGMVANPDKIVKMTVAADAK